MHPSQSPDPPSTPHAATLWVAALGYFVDLFDLWLFSLYRLEILADLQIENPLSSGVWALNAQLVGLLLGGLLFGWWVDRLGRPRALMLSILLYSVGTLATPWVQNLTELVLLRGLTGIGLAGELGVAATLLFEGVSPHRRWLASLGLILVGLWGSLAAIGISLLLPWRWAFGVGGLLGLFLLLFRSRIQESPLFERRQGANALQLLRQHPCARRRLTALSLIGLPITAIFWMVTSFSPELTAELGLVSPLPVAQTLLWMQTGYIVGDVLSILLSHWLRRRRLVVGLSLLGCALCLLGLCLRSEGDAATFLCWALALGLSAGFWGVLLTTCIEQFGTELRAGAATLIPNLARASPLLLIGAFGWSVPHFGVVPSVLAVGLCSLLGAAWGLYSLQESFGCSLDRLELEADRPETTAVESLSPSGIDPAHEIDS